MMILTDYALSINMLVRFIFTNIYLKGDKHMTFDKERLISVRKSLGYNKAEASRVLNMSAMGYGRYENGDRTPSYQTLSFIAEKFGTTVEYLMGTSKKSKVESITIRKNEYPELFELVSSVVNNKDASKRLLAYYKSLTDI